MARRRDLRRFGPGPYILGLRRNPERRGAGFRHDVPAVAAIEDLRLDAPVTLLAGDNGTGKSTLIEAIAGAIGFSSEGGELTRLGELPAVPRPVRDAALEPVLGPTKPRNGYFLRAESFFNIASFVDRADQFAPDLSLYGDVPLHEQSHGQSFLALATASAPRASTCSTSPRRRSRQPARSRSSRASCARPAAVRSSSSRRTRRSCSAARRADLRARRVRREPVRLRRPRGRRRHPRVPRGP